jgi:pilus assembly protein CpaB
MLHPLADVLVRLDRWPRRLAALTCLLLAVLTAVTAPGRATARGPDRTRVVVAAHDLGVATRLTADDLTTAAWPRDLAPPGASADPERLVGRTLAGPLRSREAVTATRLVGTGLTSGLAPGQVAAVVLADTATASLIHPGDHVDILAGPLDASEFVASSATARPPASGATVVAEAVAVLAVLPAADAGGGSAETRVLVATDRGTALRIVALQGRHVLAVVADPP